MARREVKKEESTYSWMDTYGDMITLVLCFFVLLYSFSSMSEAKWKQIVQAFTGSPPAVMISPIDAMNPTEEESGFPDGVIAEKTTTKKEREIQQYVEELENQVTALGGQIPSDPGQIEILTQEEAQLRGEFEDLFRQLQEYIEQNGLEQVIGLEMEGNRIFVLIFSGILFDSGRAEIKDEEAQAVLNNIGRMIEPQLDIIAEVNIQGHTDNVPVKEDNPNFIDNWDLSTARSAAVLRYMLEEAGLPSDKVSAAGYADKRPVASNDTEEGKARNRRVNFVINRIDKMADAQDQVTPDMISDAEQRLGQPAGDGSVNYSDLEGATGTIPAPSPTPEASPEAR